MTATTLGGRLRELRRAAGLTQEELAEKALVSRDLVSKVEQGIRTTMRVSSAKLLAGALGVEVKALLGEAIGPDHGLPPGAVIKVAASQVRHLGVRVDVMAGQVEALRAEVAALTEAIAVLARPEGGQP